LISTYITVEGEWLKFILTGEAIGYFF